MDSPLGIRRWLLAFRLSPKTAVLIAACTLLADTTQGKPPPIPDKLDLLTALAYALDNNFAIKQARERVRQEEGIVTSVTAAGLPTVTATGTYRRAGIAVLQASPMPTFFPEGPFWNVTLVGTQTLYAGGRIHSAIGGAEFSRQAAVFDLQFVINREMLRVRTRYYDTLLARDQLKVEQQNLELLERQRVDTENRVQVGRLPQFELLRAEVAVANARTPVIRARNAFRLSVEELRLALGYRDSRTDEIPEFEGELKVVSVEFDLQKALEAARAYRPDLRRLEQLVAVRESAIAVERAARFPVLTGSLGGEVRRGARGSISDALDGVRAGLSLRENLTAATPARVTQAESLANQAQLSLTEAQLAAEVEVRRAILAVEQALDLARALEKTIAQAEEAVSHAMARFQSGTATQLDVFTSQVELTRARTQTLRANHAYTIAIAQLRASMGYGDVAIEETAQPYRGIPLAPNR